MKTKLVSVLLVGLAALSASFTASVATAQSVPAAIATQVVTGSFTQADGFVATYAVVEAPRYSYSPPIGAQAVVSVMFYKDAASYAAHLRPAGFKTYTATVAQTTATFTTAALAASTPAKVAAAWILTLPDFTGATLVTD